jgi:hypothetical protein
MSERIRDFEQFQLVLDQHPYLFCGSAISGWSVLHGRTRTFLPMVGTAMEVVFQEVACLLRDGDYYERTAAAYAAEIAQGSYRWLLDRTKFEEFIGRLADQFSPADVEELVRALFHCGPGQFNHNHCAVAALLSAGAIDAFLTTNFDNGVEQALAQQLVAKHFTGVSPLPNVVKLHGDVGDVLDTLVATNLRLHVADRDRIHESAIQQLRGRVVLFAGYSAVGDIDIAPQLRELAKHGTRLIWLTKRGVPPPNFATHFLVSDLASDSPEHNWLIRLADERAQRPSSRRTGGVPNWRAAVSAWTQRLGRSELRHIVPQFLGWRVSWASLHLAEVRHAVYGASRRDEGAVSALVEAHLGALNYERAALLLDEPPGPMDPVWRVAHQGFTRWRLRDHKGAMDHLAPLLANADWSRPWIVEAARFALEVLGDWLARLPAVERREIAESFDWQTWGERLQSTPPNGVENAIFAEAARALVLVRLGLEVDGRALKATWGRARDLQMWSAAEISSRALLLIAGRRALPIAYETGRALWALRKRSLQRKLLSTLVMVTCGAADTPLHHVAMDGGRAKPTLVRIRARRCRRKAARWADAMIRNKIVIEPEPRCLLLP